MIICIGREFGSGGHEIGQLLSQQFGLEFYDQKLVDEAISKISYEDENIERLKKADERKENPFWYRASYASTDPGKRGISEHDVMFMLEMEVILEAARRDQCLFVGRCADRILQEANIPRYSIFVTAPFEDRVKRKMELLKLDEKATVSLVRKEDKARKAYYDYHTGGSWGRPSTYDLCINSSKAGIDGTVRALSKLCESSGR